MPTSNIVTLLMIIKICGRISASRLHKIIYILKMKIPYTFICRLSDLSINLLQRPRLYIRSIGSLQPTRCSDNI